MLFCPDLTRLAAFPGHLDPVARLQDAGALPGAAPEGGAMLSLSSRGLRVHRPGGAPVVEWGDPGGGSGEQWASCCLLGGGKVAVGGRGGGLSLVDLGRAWGRGEAVGARAEAGEPLTVMGPHSTRRGVACGGASGTVALRDPRTPGWKASSVLQAFQGGVMALDTSGDLLAACGLGSRGLPDPLVKIFDARFTARAVANVPFGPGPTLLKFHPALSEALLVGSPSGAVAMQQIDSGVGAVGGQLQLPLYPGCQLSCMDISATGDVFAFADTGGGVHLLGSGTMENPYCHVYVQDNWSDIPEPATLESTPPAQEGGQFGHLRKYSPPVPPALGGRPELSAIPTHKTMQVGQPPRVVDNSLLTKLRQVDFVGYIPTPGFEANRAFGVASKQVAALRAKRQEPSKGNITGDGGGAVGGGGGTKPKTKASSKDGSVLPGRYHSVEITKQGRFEEFDFTRYNRTRFAGLENNIANCYCNALLQVLFFTLPFCQRVLALKPDPHKEFQLHDELSFLMYMLQQAEGVPCQAQNLLRLLGQSREALALGLLEGAEGNTDVELETTKDTNLPRRVQALCRFLMGHLHKEATAANKSGRHVRSGGGGETGSSGGTMVGQVFGTQVMTIAKCSSCHAEMVKTNTSFQVDLQYPRRTDAEQPSFCELLTESIIQKSELKAWCDKCKAYRGLSQRRAPASLPQTLVVNCNLQNMEDVKLWHPVKGRGGTGDSGLPPGQEHWLPSSLAIQLDQKKGDLTISEENSQEDGEAAIFDLTAVICHVVDDDERGSLDDSTGHLVAHVKCYPPYSSRKQLVSPLTKRPGAAAVAAKGGGTGGAAKTPLNTAKAKATSRTGEYASPAVVTPQSATDWMLFNDFCVTFSSESEVKQLYGSRKVPCLLFFTQRSSIRDGELNSLRPAQVLTQDAFLKLCNAPPLQGNVHNRLLPRTFRPLDISDAPKPGTIFAIDAEFVALSQAQTDILSDGSEVVTRQARLGLGRVSVVRGEGPSEGECCIDDYVRAVEPVHDYLTRYSGLVAGDLDAGTSRHHLTTLKATYLKLRYLADLGCRFVGHGLKNDFRMINIILPPEQVLDTVHLFRLPGQRFFSLRFLSAYLLKQDIQAETHDSIEDARAALDLYKVYLRLQESGELKAKIEEMYEWGRIHGYNPEKLQQQRGGQSK